MIKGHRTFYRTPRRRCAVASTTLLLALCVLSVATPAAHSQTTSRTQTRPTSQTSRRTRQGDSSAQTPDALLNSLPPALREHGRRLLNERDDEERAHLAEKLAKENAAEASDFLLAVLDTESAAGVRRAIIDYLGKYDHTRVRSMLRVRAMTDADAGVAVLALDRLRALQTQDLRALLTERMEKARRGTDEKSLRLLEAEQERWISLVRGVALPAFLRVVPPVFSLKQTDQFVRVLAFGDFGTGSEEQKKLAAAMLHVNQATPFDFGLTLGDNFYQEGMTSPTDPRWKTWWDEMYAPLGIKFYATLGNHDWYGADSPAAEILYTQRSRTWNMPAPYYTFTAGAAQFFALDTNEISDAQLRWLTNELDASRAHWKIVYGHHPIFSVAPRGDSQKLIGKLLPVLKGRADIYLTGHEHNLQHLKPEGNLHFFIVGGGGQKLDKLTTGGRALFARRDYGFSVLEVNQQQLKIRFIGTDGNQLYEYALQK